jgi:beta-phosphoglucomutase
MNKKFSAFLFDLNGTIVDDMHYHITAWHKIFLALGVDMTYEETKAQCYGKNEEVLERVLPGRFSFEERTAMGISKERKYQEEFRPFLQPIAGLESFLQAAKDAGIKMGIGSAAIKYNVDFVLDGLNIRQYFEVIVSADDVAHSKPHPETFLKGASLLGIAPEKCLVLEDATKGVEAAIHASMKSLVLTTMHEKDDFIKYDDHIIAYGKNYLEFPSINDILMNKQEAQTLM